MIIYFLETEEPESEEYRAALPEHDLRFVADLAEVGEDAEVLSLFINSPIDEAFLSTHPKLRFIATRSGAVDHLDLCACRNHGVLVSHVPEYGSHTVAEHTFALILSLSRRLREAMAQPHRPGRFSYEANRAFDLHGKTLGIVGFGHIGRQVAELAVAFKMRVIAHEPMPNATHGEMAGVHFLPREQFLAEAQIISLHMRLSPWTYHFLNRETLALCQPGVIVINTSRGRLIDTRALQEALESGQVGGAGLDVLEEESVMRHAASQVISEQIVQKLRGEVDGSPPPAARLKDLQELVASDALLARDNVVFTPHVAFNSVEAVERLIAGTIENLRAFASGQPIHLAEPS